MTTYEHQVTLEKNLLIDLENLVNSFIKEEFEQKHKHQPLGLLTKFRNFFTSKKNKKSPKSDFQAFIDEYDKRETENSYLIISSSLAYAKERLGSSNENATFSLDSRPLRLLENLLKDKCKAYKDETGSPAFNSLTGEPLHDVAKMLEAVRFAYKNIVITSDSSAFYS